MEPTTVALESEEDFEIRGWLQNVESINLVAGSHVWERERESDWRGYSRVCERERRRDLADTGPQTARYKHDHYTNTQTVLSKHKHGQSQKLRTSERTKCHVFALNEFWDVEISQLNQCCRYFMDF
ncbi:hypothetical protein J6590_033012 [Homalodisca vitripennis]|nr:hypothetical protein J6590_033012 [Homalodisca vitripennis]